MGNKMPSYYINRELSWLDFNYRVLEEAVKESNPPLERLKFLSIYSSNIDEFFMVRVGSLIDQSISEHDFVDSISGMNSSEQLEKIYKKTKSIDKYLIEQTPKLVKELAKNNIVHITPNDIKNKLDFEFYFERSLMPMLTIMVLDGKHPFPYISNKSVFVGIKMKTKNEKEKYGVVLFPKNADMVLFQTRNEDKIEFMLFEEIVEFYINKLFANYEVLKSGVFKVIRNADLILDDDLISDSDDYKQAMADILKRRKMLTPVRLQTNLNKNNDLVKYFTTNFQLDEEQVFYGYPYLHSGVAFDIISKASNLGFNHLMYKPTKRVHVGGLEKGTSIIEKVLQKDYLMIHPFERFETIIRLLNEASKDPNVLSIKQTLYRVGNESAIVRALAEAAENGKDVTVLLELKARFDEQNNLNYASKLEEAGCRVIYGKDNLKVHAKSILITRKDKRNVNYICHIGTGNYNENTAKLYTDIGFLTSDKEIALDLVGVFNVLQGGQQEEYTKLAVSPDGIRLAMYDLIDKEIFNAKHGLKAHMIFKFNSLADKDMIDKLVEASQAGVKVQLIVRGICCLKAGVEGYSENIEIISIVGKYLEHSRIYWFYNDGQYKVYISSADLMSRNLNRRVEIACPIEDPQLKERLLDSLHIMLKDYGSGRRMIKNGTYVPVEKVEKGVKNSQMVLYGKAVKLSEKNSIVPEEKGLFYKFKKSVADSLRSLASNIDPKH